MALGYEEIVNRFATHGGDADIAAQHEALRGAYIAFAEYLDERLTDGRAKSIVMTQLQDASMWSHFALAEKAPVIEPSPSTKVKSKPVPVPGPPRMAAPGRFGNG